VRGGSLSNPDVIELLKPFLLASWHGSGTNLPSEIQALFEKSGVARNINVFGFALDSKGELAHGFPALPGGRAPNYFKEEVAKAVDKLKPAKVEPKGTALPDLKGSGPPPAGVRIFLRSSESGRGKPAPIVEVVATPPETWNLLAYPDQPRDVEAQALKAWLVQLYPAAIRTADQSKPFKTIAGSLKLQAAGGDAKRRVALLRGDVRLSKGGETESEVEGRLELVLTYAADAADAISARGFFEGTYLYRQRGELKFQLAAAIESRP